MPFAPLYLAQRAQNTQYFETAPKSVIYEYVGFARLPDKRQNDPRERRRRERRKFGAFYATFTQKCLLHNCAWHKQHKTHSVLRKLQSHSFTNARILRAPPGQRENDRRERRRRERGKFGAFCTSFTQKCLLHHWPWQKCSKARSIVRMLQSPLFTNTWVLRAPPGQRENDARERRRRERRKFGAFCAGFTQKCLLHHWPSQKVLKTRSVVRMLPSHSCTNTSVLRAPSEQEENDARERRRRERRKFTRVLSRSTVCTTVLGKKCSTRSVLRMLQSHSFANA